MKTRSMRRALALSSVTTDSPVVTKARPTGKKRKMSTAVAAALLSASSSKSSGVNALPVPSAATISSSPLSSPLLNIGPLTPGTILRRPSSIIRSPYVADVVLPDGSVILAHSPALDVGGLASVDSKVLLSERPPGGKTQYTIELVYCTGPECGVSGEELVGANPRLGEKIAKKAIEQNLLGYGTESIREQVTMNDSRVDFVLGEADGGQEHIIEVKNVVCADYRAATAPEKKGKNHCVVSVDLPAEEYKRAGIFPWGRLGQEFKGEKVVSERAIKHVRNLSKLCSKSGGGHRASVLFVVNRGDCEVMRACHEQDEVFAREMKKAKESGVGVDAFRVRWTEEGEAWFDGVVPFIA